MADKKRMKRKRTRTAQAPVKTHEYTPTRKPTSFDNLGMSLRCIQCEEIWNGPHKGEKIKRFSTESRALQEEGERLGYAQPGASDGVCGKRSCVEKQSRKMVGELEGMYPGEDFSELEQRMNEEAYDVRRNDKDRYPEGLIDDVEPPL